MEYTHARSITRRVVAAAAATATLAMAAALGLPSANAHDVVIGGTPEPGGVVDEFPDEIVLEFSGIPQESFNTVAVSDEDGILFDGEPELDERLVIMDVPDDVDPGPGNYTVGFQITSSDGHATRGSVSFEVAGAADGETDSTATDNTATDNPADTTETEDPEQTTDPEDQLLAGPLGWVFGGLGVIVILGVLVMMIAKNRNNSSKD